MPYPFTILKENNGVINFKACPKCRGDLRLERDYYGNYLQCFQCSRIFELAAPFQSAPLRKTG